MAVLATEALSNAGVEFPPFALSTVERIQERQPNFANPPNPLDVGPGAMPHDFNHYLSTVAADKSAEAVCISLPMGARGWNTQIVDDTLAVAAASEKPFVVLWYGGEEARQQALRLRRAGILVVETASELGRVTRALLASGPAVDVEDPADDATGGAPSFGGARALSVLLEGGADIAPMAVCGDNPGAIVSAAKELGFPVVLKSADAGVAHRLELGLVAVGLESDIELVAALDRMRGAALETGTSTWIVQKMIRGGVELVLTVRDAEDLGIFGSVGIGGAAVELLHDVESVPLPCDEAALVAVLRRLKLKSLLFGFRGSDPIDIPWVHRTLHVLAEVLRLNNLIEIEVNPALADSSGGVIVDALCVSA